jgi:hypothetical protein
LAPGGADASRFVTHALHLGIPLRCFALQGDSNSLPALALPDEKRSVGGPQARSRSPGLIAACREPPRRPPGSIGACREPPHEPPGLIGACREPPYRPPGLIGACREPPRRPPGLIAACREPPRRPPGSIGACREPPHRPPGLIGACREPPRRPPGLIGACREPPYRPPGLIGACREPPRRPPGLIGACREPAADLCGLAPPAARLSSVSGASSDASARLLGDFRATGWPPGPRRRQERKPALSSGARPRGHRLGGQRRG